MAFLKKRTVKDFDIIIGLDSSIDGEIISSGSIRIDGRVSGSIKSKGDVIVGLDAKVNADIEAQYCEISGKVEGNVHSESQLRIYEAGSLTGDITVSSFAIEEGGIFSGNCDINPDKKTSIKNEKKKFAKDDKSNDVKDKNKNNNENDNKSNNDKNNNKSK